MRFIKQFNQNNTPLLIFLTIKYRTKMKKNYLLLLFALLLFAGKGMAQINPCNTVEATKHLYETNPDARRFMDEVAAGLKNFDFKNAHKTTDSATSDTFWYDIPIVVHIVHDYNYYYLFLLQMQC